MTTKTLFIPHHIVKKFYMIFEISIDDQMHFLYGVVATDMEQLRSLLQADDEFHAKWGNLTKRNIPSSKWLKQNVLPKNVWFFKERGEDSGANSILTPLSYTYDSLVESVRLINPGAAKRMPPTLQVFYYASICEYDSICISNFFPVASNVLKMF